MDIRIDATNLKKVFNRRVVFQHISFSLQNGQTLLIIGRNGSGKSTLVKIVSGVLTPSEGSVSLRSHSRDLSHTRIGFIGLVSPYLQMYDEFSARENLRFALAIRGLQRDPSTTDMLLDRVRLADRADDPVRTYSSGMKQRLKYAFALVHHPQVLILDEPTANLDADGIDIVQEIMREHQQSGILIVATNDLRDIDHYDSQVDLNATH